MCLVLTTVGSADQAEELARELVARRLAACVSIVPGVVSHYVWRGTACREPEWLLLIKTTGDGYEGLAAALTALHPYEVPELVRLDPTAVGAPYLAWLTAGVGPSGA